VPRAVSPYNNLVIFQRRSITTYYILWMTALAFIAQWASTVAIAVWLAWTLTVAGGQRTDRVERRESLFFALVMSTRCSKGFGSLACSLFSSCNVPTARVHSLPVLFGGRWDADAAVCFYLHRLSSTPASRCCGCGRQRPISYWMPFDNPPEVAIRFPLLEAIGVRRAEGISSLAKWWIGTAAAFVHQGITCIVAAALNRRPTSPPATGGQGRQ
jgi:hypothetical protein